MQQAVSGQSFPMTPQRFQHKGGNLWLERRLEGGQLAGQGQPARGSRIHPSVTWAKETSAEEVQTEAKPGCLF